MGRYNPDSHNTLKSFDLSKGHFEFPYIKSNFLMGYKEKGIFSDKEYKNITQEIIFSSIKHQLQFIYFRNLIRILNLLLKEYPILNLKKIYRKFKN